jgi:hypothetical protein
MATASVDEVHQDFGAIVHSNARVHPRDDVDMTAA